MNTFSPENTIISPRLLAAHWNHIWFEGDPTILVPPLVAIVGTRNPDNAGLLQTIRFAKALAQNNITVLSGGAIGIDAAAHCATLDAGGKTAVVLPAGLKQLYPARHGPLYDSILRAGGLLISPFPPETPPSRWTFPKRNELLAAICDVLVVVQAPSASGSLITAEAAMKLGRRILAVPASPDDPRGAGCLRLLRAGAQLCSTEEDLIASLRFADGPLLPPTGEETQLDFWSNETQGKTSMKPVRIRDVPAVHSAKNQRKQRELPNNPPQTNRTVAQAPNNVLQNPGETKEVTYTLDEVSALVYQSVGQTPTHLDELTAITGLHAGKLRSSVMQLVVLGLVTERNDGMFVRS